MSQFSAENWVASGIHADRLWSGPILMLRNGKPCDLHICAGFPRKTAAAMVSSMENRRAWRVGRLMQTARPMTKHSFR